MKTRTKKNTKRGFRRCVGVLMLCHVARWWNIHSRDFNGSTVTTTAAEICSTRKSILCWWSFHENSHSDEKRRWTSPEGAESSRTFPVFPPQIFSHLYNIHPSCRPLTSAFCARLYVKLTQIPLAISLKHVWSRETPPDTERGISPAKLLSWHRTNYSEKNA